MSKLLSALTVLLISSSAASAEGLFITGGPGFAKSLEEAVIGIRYQHDTSRLFYRASYYEAVYLYWTNSCRAHGLGFARSIVRESGGNGSFSASAGLIGVSRRTEHLGTSLQFYFRFAYEMKRGRNMSIDLIHISNGKSIFGWDGHNSGENFVTLSIRIL